MNLYLVSEKLDRFSMMVMKGMHAIVFMKGIS